MSGPLRFGPGTIIPEPPPPTALDNEIAARIAADAAEATARAAEDAALNAAIVAETNRAIAAENAILIGGSGGQTAAQWMLLDLSGLPTTDPGFGRPWLSGLVVQIGSLPAAMQIEDGTGHWLLEDGSGSWEFA
jgi:hypothetical protein